MSEEATWDREKGELRILGQRHTAIDAQNLCDFLDSLVGIQVAEVIMHNLEYRLGKLNAAKLRTENPKNTLDQLIEILTRTDRLSGAGITKVVRAGNPNDPIQVEIENPSVKGTTGAAKSFIFSWWAGALTSLFDREFDVKNVAYDEEKNVLKGQIVPR